VYRGTQPEAIRIVKGQKGTHNHRLIGKTCAAVRFGKGLREGIGGEGAWSNEWRMDPRQEGRGKRRSGKGFGKVRAEGGCVKG